jgi:hypothetical protein
VRARIVCRPRGTTGGLAPPAWVKWGAPSGPRHLAPHAKRVAERSTRSLTYARRHWQTSDDASARDDGARGAGGEQRARLNACASRVAKRRAVAQVRGRRPMRGSGAPSVVSPGCRSSRHPVAPWKLRGARPMRDRGPRGTFPIAGDRPRLVKRDAARSLSMLPSVLPGLGATSPPRNPG